MELNIDVSIFLFVFIIAVGRYFLLVFDFLWIIENVNVSCNFCVFIFWIILTFWALIKNICYLLRTSLR